MSEASGKGRGRQTAIGAFVLGGVALLMAVIVLFGKFNLFSPTTRIAIVFQDSISGLAVGAPVTFRGVRIGAVARIGVEFDPTTLAAYIPVIVELEPKRVVLTQENKRTAMNMTQLIAGGLRAELNTQSFVTGQSEIDLDFYPGTDAMLHPAITHLPEIPTRQSAIQRVKEQLSQLPLHELADNANATLQSLRTLSEKLDHSLPPLIDSLRAAAARSAGAVGAASDSLAAMQKRLDTTLDDISRLANAGTLLVGQRGAELHTLLLSSNQTVLQAREVIADLKGVTAERGADRANVDSALRDLATAAGALRGLANDVEHNPQLLLTGRRP